MSHNTLMPAAPAPAAPAAVVDALNSLLEAEYHSVFRFMAEGSPYLSRASGEVRRPLAQMVESNARHCADLYGLIENLNGDPSTRGIQNEEQYLAFLSLKFLLPKLVDAKKLTIQRYKNALQAIGRGPDDVNAVLEGHLAEHRLELQALEKAAVHVATKK